MNLKRDIAVVGRGKTGAAVIEVLSEKGSKPIVFSRENPINEAAIRAGKLTDVRALIVFIPAHGLVENLADLVASGVPVVCGTTGFTWPSELDAELKQRGVAWIVGSNFSPGMNFVFSMAKLAAKHLAFLGNPELLIHEIHHVHKKDSPSGTALKLNECLSGQAMISADRVGDHPGLHELTLSNGLEKVTLKHEAISRRAFALGAVFAAESLLPTLSPGLHSFESLMQKQILGDAL